jgi:diguanylate cyclase (GGDEF)-like protein
MKKQARGDELRSANGSSVEGRTAVIDAERAMRNDQTAADADQTASDADQTSSDADQAASDADDQSADIDQLASDRDQETADREHAAGTHTKTDEGEYQRSRGERQSVAIERLGNRLKRARTGRARDATAKRRDRVAVDRDAAGQIRDARATAKVRTSDEPDSDLLRRLEALAAEAAADRARAAADRERAARDREKAARTRARLEAELERAYLDELTGAYRREMGRTALSHEIERARRSDGRFVLAFVDVDELKAVNDRDGHAAGDRVLQGVTDAIRARLRSFDPIVRWGGDEFVCGLGGTDRTEARRSFIEIAKAIKDDVHVGISVGLAALGAIETVDGLTERADAAMLTIKARHHARA